MVHMTLIHQHSSMYLCHRTPFEMWLTGRVSGALVMLLINIYFLRRLHIFPTFPYIFIFISIVPQFLPLNMTVWCIWVLGKKLKHELDERTWGIIPSFAHSTQHYLLYTQVTTSLVWCCDTPKMNFKYFPASDFPSAKCSPTAILPKCCCSPKTHLTLWLPKPFSPKYSCAVTELFLNGLWLVTLKIMVNHTKAIPQAKAVNNGWRTWLQKQS